LHYEPPKHDINAKNASRIGHIKGIWLPLPCRLFILGISIRDASFMLLPDTSWSSLLRWRYSL